MGHKVEEQGRSVRWVRWGSEDGLWMVYFYIQGGRDGMWAVEWVR